MAAVPPMLIMFLVYLKQNAISVMLPAIEAIGPPVTILIGEAVVIISGISSRFAYHATGGKKDQIENLL